MESEERKILSKAAKKDGKHSKAQNVEEEAIRREEIKEKLRERLELEKRALQVVERLLEDVVAEDFLIDCARFITPANYKDAVEERFITKLCGYPLCPNKLGKIPSQKYKISTKPNKVYDITERKCFCSNFCYKASKEFEVQISTTPLWLRQYERPVDIQLMKKRDIGSSGEEVRLTQKRLHKQDVENPENAQPEDPQEHFFSDHSSDGELEQDFISSVVSQRQKASVHWGDLPKRTDGKKGGRGVGAGLNTLKREEDGKVQQSQGSSEEPAKQMQEEIRVEDVTEKPDPCSLHIAASTQEGHATPPNSSTSTASGEFVNTDCPALPGFNIIQVGMSKRGAQGLRDLVKNHTQPPAAKLNGWNLLESLTLTLKEWLTDETLKFLHQLDSPPTNSKEEEEEEKLDEDDLAERGGGEVVAEEQKRPTLPTPDYETLKKETQQLGLKVREFYKGSCGNGREADQRSNTRLPLVDSRAQHLIQKRIIVEKIANCLKNIVGPLSLTLSDISTDLNNLVRTFRLTNTNIIHKTPVWTLIAVVILHLVAGTGSRWVKCLAQRHNGSDEDGGSEDRT
ncbi:putative RNA polymerase II subunit B1 CTD phosphatase rpap2 isoform X2 [Nerophis ophidion]|uniref:putative RNA polymerase II subunit B1 CTD phosphatase rpap2 isoform X2 n=1 Tax=Nerophis ophidion TaxID=159077 RepID=UPI002AE045F0|nr:putative RNA polymerase II subunit B1 CTD phosphatase rpap2 isoform X2 [Nerophis ophidion]